MASYPCIQQPLPLIMTHMKFRLAPWLPLPKFTMCMEFSCNCFRRETIEDESSPNERGRQREEGGQSVSSDDLEGGDLSQSVSLDDLEDGGPSQSISPDDLDDGSQGNSDTNSHDALPQTGSPVQASRIMLSHPSVTNKIPKPPGEPGRPGSGRYCVHTVLMKTHNWSGESVDKLTVSISCCEAHHPWPDLAAFSPESRPC